MFGMPCAKPPYERRAACGAERDANRRPNFRSPSSTIARDIFSGRPHSRVVSGPALTVGSMPSFPASRGDAKLERVHRRSGQGELAVNGVQTLGHVVVAAVRQINDLRAAGVVSLRLSPHGCDMISVARIFRDLADARIDPEEAVAALADLSLPGSLSDGYLRGLAGVRQLAETD